MSDYQTIDAVCNIWTPEALSHRPGWTDEFFVGKVKGKHDSAGITLEAMIEGMDEAGIDIAFLVAAKAGRVGLPGCYHMPLEVVSRAVEQYPDRFRGHARTRPLYGYERRSTVRNRGQGVWLCGRTFISALVRIAAE
jgi:predicted TIM-barrel fold metal-dependent hydrolase